MTATTIASAEQVGKILEVLKRAMPRGAMFERIKDETGYSTDIIWSAIHILERDGTIQGRDPFAYDPVEAAAAAEANAGK